MNLLRKILTTGRVTDPASDSAAVDEPALPGTERLRGSLQIRHVDAGSCNGCELEVVSTFGPVYDGERFGVRLVASPRHADALMVTGPVTRNMAVPLAKTFEATPSPKLVIALGDCACNRGVFAGGYGVEGAVRDVVPVDLEVPGCPPDPTAILRALRRIVRR
jgi:Ni,Fe-hydrogenase III small subunit